MQLRIAFALLASLSISVNALPRPQDASVTPMTISASDAAVASATVAAVDPQSTDSSGDVIVDVTVTQVGTAPIGDPTDTPSSDDPTDPTDSDPTDTDVAVPSATDVTVVPSATDVTDPGATDVPPAGEPTDPVGGSARPTGVRPSHTFSFDGTIPSGVGASGRPHHFFHHWGGDRLAGASGKADWSGFSGAARPTGTGIAGSGGDGGGRGGDETPPYVSYNSSWRLGTATNGGPVLLATGSSGGNAGEGGEGGGESRAGDAGNDVSSSGDDMGGAVATGGGPIALATGGALPSGIL